MSDRVGFQVRLDVSGKSEAVVTDYCITHLRQRGYYVAAPGAAWEKPRAFCKRVGMYPHRLHEWVERYQRRGVLPIQVERPTPDGSISALQSNPAFDDFCRSLCRPRN